MHYDRFSEKNELTLLGHMCNLKVEADKINDFFAFLKKQNFKANMVCTKLGEYFYVSFFSLTDKRSEDLYEILLTWNP